MSAAGSSAMSGASRWLAPRATPERVGTRLAARANLRRPVHRVDSMRFPPGPAKPVRGVGWASGIARPRPLLRRRLRFGFPGGQNQQGVCSCGTIVRGGLPMNHPPLRFGIFLAPFHPVREDPTACLDRDLELVKWLDELRYDEAWIGEHHSAGFEIIGSPEIFIAIAAQHTKHIRLGTGVISVPYHHPFMIAERIVQLDHMTRGRVMFGSGPGALQSDARMLGIEASTQRERLDEGPGVILRR